MNKIFAEDPSSDSELISITPSINLVDVSSNAGYNDVAAAADITDNSTDAQADTVWVTIGIHKGKPRIIIADNGCGMDKKVSSGCLVMGAAEVELGDKRKTTNDMSGKFGMGMNFATAYYQGDVWFLTDGQDGFHKVEYIKADMEKRWYDEVKKSGGRPQWTIPLSQGTEKDREFFNHHTGNSKQGTVLVIENINRFETVQSIKDKIQRDFARIFRRYITSGKTRFYLNGNEIKAVDPMFTTNLPDGVKPSTILSHKEWNDLPYIDKKTGELKHDGWLRYTSYSLDVEPDEQVASDLKWNLRTQGIYWMRNNREIDSGTWLDMIPKRPTNNRLRVEVDSSPNMDDENGIDFKKLQVNPKQSILDRLRPLIKQDEKLHFARVEAVREAPEKNADLKKWQKMINRHLESLKSILPKKAEPTLDENNEPKDKTLPKPLTTPRNINPFAKNSKPGDFFIIDFFQGGVRGPAFKGQIQTVGKRCVLYLNQDHSLWLDYFDRASHSQRSIIALLLISYIQAKYKEGDDNFIYQCEDVESRLGGLLATFLQNKPGVKA